MFFFFFCRKFFFFFYLAEQHLYVHCTAGTLTCYLCACLLYLLLLWFSGTARSWKSENWPWQIYVAENARWLRPYVHKWCNALLLKMRCVGRQGQNPLNSLMATFSEHWKMGCYPRKKKKSTAKCFSERKKKKNTMGKLPANFQWYCWISKEPCASSSAMLSLVSVWPWPHKGFTICGFSRQKVAYGLTTTQDMAIMKQPWRKLLSGMLWKQYR